MNKNWAQSILFLVGMLLNKEKTRLVSLFPWLFFVILCP